MAAVAQPCRSQYTHIGCVCASLSLSLCTFQTKVCLFSCLAVCLSESAPDQLQHLAQVSFIEVHRRSDACDHHFRWLQPGYDAVVLDEHKQHLLQLAGGQVGALLAACSVAAAAQVQLPGGAGGGVGVPQQLCKGLPALTQQDLRHFLHVCGDRGARASVGGAALLPAGWLAAQGGSIDCSAAANSPQAACRNFRGSPGMPG